MLASTVIRRCLLPAAVLVAEAKLNQKNEEPTPPSLTCRPSELPIYTPDSVPIQQQLGKDHTPNVIENSVRSVRQAFGKLSKEYNAYEQVAKQSLSESKQNIQWLVDYLRQEDNTLPKAGAIGIGALTGLILGLRGGIFKRTIYATTGILGMASVCYPKEAAEYAEISIIEGKKYLTIAYNFAYGVKQDEPPLELPSLPKLPSSASDAWSSIKSLISDDAAGKTETVNNSAPNKIEAPKSK
ncbi:MICOS complex subunit MIC27 isoform X2 [Euwallacea fornicatus]|uniref:MICOS complex subunit MIC27 isoform X2 n=1 Tax=Euwallacea fornicatus TaxID=995702 RepID=UPI003390187A